MPRLLRLGAARAFRIAMRVVPARRRVFVTAWPADEGNVVEVVRALSKRYPGEIVWADPPTDARLRQLGLDPDRIVRTPKRSGLAVKAFLSAEASFFTHGVYGCPRPVRNKAMVNLWHGDGPKAAAGSPVPSTFLVSGSRFFGYGRAQEFGVAPADVLLTGLPRTAQFRHRLPPEQLRQLGIDPAMPFVLWLPTFRQTGSGGVNAARSDTADPAGDRDLVAELAPGAAALTAMGIQLVVKAHPSDRVSRQVADLTTVTDAALEEAGTTLYALLGASAGLITDYSSVWVDYLATDRPIAFFMPDLDSYVSGRGLYDHTLEHLPGERLSHLRDFIAFGAEVLDEAAEPGSTRRTLARNYFETVQKGNPAEGLLDELARRGVLDPGSDSQGDTAVPIRRLDGFTGRGYDKGRPPLMQLLWLLVSGLVFRRWWCPANLRVAILRAFGATIGQGVLIRHDVKIHWPWKLTVGDHSWIGEQAWILNLEPVTIGSQVCISQGVLLCTGSHDRHSPTFEFDNAPIEIGEGAWIAARATVLRGVTIGRGAVVGATALVSEDVAAEALVLAPRGTTKSWSPSGRD